MFGTKKNENQHPHVKYTKLGEPYLDFEEFHKSGLDKKLEKRMEEIDKIIVESASPDKDKDSRSESS